MMPFSSADIPSQDGRIAIVTGPSLGGLGYETALALAGKGAEVILAGRNPEKLAASETAIRQAHAKAKVTSEALDLANLKNIEAFAQRVSGAREKIDLLINNAGVMALRKRTLTADGFEMQFGANHLGHFALTGRLLPLLRKAKGRVVNVASMAHRTGRMNFGNLQGETRYIPWVAYCQSKLANLLFTFEFERRAQAGGWGVTASAAHPGYATTELIANGPGDMGPFARLLAPLASHGPAAGALPTLAAAASPKSGEYWGPNGFYELRGPPALARVMPQARDAVAAKRLWEVSEELTGVRFA
jgi:NAD(P)-dependent dehydrogenase (short-subunit alcohol dehydrogenase family)